MNKLKSRISNRASKGQQVKEKWSERHFYLSAIAFSLCEVLLPLVILLILSQSTLVYFENFVEIVILIWWGINLLVVLIFSILSVRTSKIQKDLLNVIRATIYAMAGLTVFLKILVSCGVEWEYAKKLGSVNLVDILACYIAFDTSINIIINEVGKARERGSP